MATPRTTPAGGGPPVGPGRTAPRTIVATRTLAVCLALSPLQLPATAAAVEPVEVLSVGVVDPAEMAALRGAVLSDPSRQPPFPAPAPTGCAASALETSLSRAARAERAFDLDAALASYAAGCACSSSGALTGEAWALWERSCEGGARAAFGVGDGEALDLQLSALLTARPERHLDTAHFPPEVVERAQEIAALQRRGTLRVAGAATAVAVDGEARGVTPLLLDAVPAGSHVVDCGSRSLAVRVPPGGEASLSCPPGADAERTAALLSQLQGGGICWVLVGEGAAWDGMDGGVWVFLGGTAPVGIRVGPVPAEEDVARWERAVSAVRAAGGGD